MKGSNQIDYITQYAQHAFKTMTNKENEISNLSQATHSKTNQKTSTQPKTAEIRKKETKIYLTSLSLQAKLTHAVDDKAYECTSPSHIK